MKPDLSLLRNIPKMDEILASPAVALAAAETSHTAAAEAAREVLSQLREAILGGECGQMPTLDELAALVAGRAQQNSRPSLRPVINATGVILHTNLGRAPLAKCAVEAVCAVADSYSTLEYNVEAGSRGSRYSHVEGLLKKLTGAEDALVVNNNASAVLLILDTMAKGREVPISRGELVEIGGSFRVPAVMAQSGGILVEVGTTNKTHPEDYENAIDPERTGALLKVHTSNFKILGFTEDVPLAKMVEIGHRHHLPVIHDLGSGSLIPLTQFGILDEPTVLESMEAGVDVLSFSGDKLLGGPQAGIIVGKHEYIAKMKKNHLTRALRIDKMTLAALEATLRLYLEPERAIREIPTLRMLSEGRETLREKAGRLQALLAPLGVSEVVDEFSQVGGGSVPTQLLPSAAVAVSPQSISVAELERRLRSCERPIVARIAKDRLLLDLRTIEERDFHEIANSLAACLAG